MGKAQRAELRGALPIFAVSSLLAAAVGAGPISWLPAGLPGHPAITAMATAQTDFLFPRPGNPALLAATVGAGVFRSTDIGSTWNPTGPGLEGHDAVALAVRQTVTVDVDVAHFQTTAFAGTASAGLYRLANGATAWIASNTGLTSLDVRALAVGGGGVVSNGNPAVVYAGTAGGLFASTDGGDTWLRKAIGLPSGTDAAITAIATDPSSPLTLYVGTDAGLFKSVDGGETWAGLQTGVVGRLSIIAVAVDPRLPSHLYASARIPCTGVCPAANVPFPASFRSQDGGLTWSPMNVFGFALAFVATPNLPSRVFAGTLNGVQESLDAGATWAPVNDGLGSVAPSVSSFVILPILPSYLFAGTSQGVFRAELGQSDCGPDGYKLCLNGQRFEVSVGVFGPAGERISARAVPMTDSSGGFWFFSPDNLDLVVKVLDGRSINGKFWVFYGSLTNLEFVLIVRDASLPYGLYRDYHNLPGRLTSVADTSAF